MNISARGAFSGIIIAPATGAFVAIAGMLVHLYATQPEAADLTVGEIAPLAASLWFSGLFFAYPVALAFVVIWLAFRAMGQSGLGLWIGGALAGVAAMGLYLTRLHGGPILSALAGGQDVSTLTLGALPGAFALPLIGALAGIVAAFVFAAFARR